MRLFGGEIGVAVMSWFIRTREQTHSNLLGQHVMSGSSLAQARLAGAAASLQSRSLGLGEAQARALSTLGRSVQSQADVLAFIDAMTLVAGATIVSLC